jgi:hypothetical protein
MTAPVAPRASRSRLAVTEETESLHDVPHGSLFFLVTQIEDFSAALFGQKAEGLWDFVRCAI